MMMMDDDDQANRLQLDTLWRGSHLSARPSGILMSCEDSIHPNIGLFLFCFFLNCGFTAVYVM